MPSPSTVCFYFRMIKDKQKQKKVSINLDLFPSEVKGHFQQNKRSFKPLAGPPPPALPLQIINKRIPTWHDAQILQIEWTINTQQALRAAEIPFLLCGVLLP